MRVSGRRCMRILVEFCDGEGGGMGSLDNEPARKERVSARLGARTGEQLRD